LDLGRFYGRFPPRFKDAADSTHNLYAPATARRGILAGDLNFP
jgi:hypothetical protein